MYYEPEPLTEWEALDAYYKYFETEEYKAELAIQRSIERHERKLYKQWYNSLTPAQKKEEDSLKF